MFKINPYRPGAGLMPGYIAGREKDITNIEQIFDALIMNIPVQSVIFSGLRGVGKTVLINKLESIAAEKKIFCKHIEIEERNDFISQIAERELYTSGNLTQSLTEVFVSIGELGAKTGTPICFFIDEIQYMKQKELGALIAALHRANQLGYPIMIIGAGLPKIYKMLSEEKSYSERLFM